MISSSTDKTLLLKNAQVLVTMDYALREIEDGAILIRGGVIAAVGKTAELPHEADEVIDCRGQVVMPGLVNTHHHMYQSLTRAVAAAQNCELFGWLKTLYPLWARLTPEMIAASTKTAMAELLLSGCTTTADHLYLFPNGCRLDDSIDAACTMGMRFHAARGSMSVGESQGGLPPDILVEEEEFILRDTRRVIEAWHDPRPYAMVRVAVAPCSPFSVSHSLMKESAALARSYGVGLHTHLAENAHDIAYTREKFHCTPAQYAEQLAWLGRDVWHAHCVHLDAAGITLFAHSKTGVAHCPTSNMRLASGIAPIRSMRDQGVPVGLGVDGSASNDGAHMLAEARQSMLLARVGSSDPQNLTARDALFMATRGGAEVLGRDDIGMLAQGKAADCVTFDLTALPYAGMADPVAALIFATAQNVHTSVINGKVVVRNHHLMTASLPEILTHHHRLSCQLMSGV